MSSELQDIIIRKARHDDYEDLLEIGDVHFGKDYFQAHYHSFFEDPDIYALVAEIGGKAVGFYLSQVIDNGQTIIKRAGRVHPSYRGHGVFHLLSEALDKHCKESLLGVKCETFGTTNKLDRAVKELQEKGFQEVIRKKVLNMFVRVKDLKGLDEGTEEGKRINKMTYGDFKLLFANDDLVTRLIPKRVLFNCYTGYKIHESNIKHIINDNEFVLASIRASTYTILPSTSPQSSDEVKGQHNFTPEALNNIDIISCVRIHMGVLGLSYQIDFYTADGYEESTIKAHLINHFCNFRKSTNEDGITLITFNSNLNEQLVLSYLRDLGIVEYMPGTEAQKVLYEKTL